MMSKFRAPAHARAIYAWAWRGLEGRVHGPALSRREDQGKVSGSGGTLEAMAAPTAPSVVRVLFCGDAAFFPTSVTRTQAALASHPHIVVEALRNEDIDERIHEYDMCVCRVSRLDANTLSRAKRLKVITQFGMGLEGVDLQAAKSLGIRVARIQSAGIGNSLSCAEHAIYLILSLLRNQKAMTRAVLQGLVGVPEGRTLFGKTVLIVGYGNIGKDLVPRLKAFGVRVLATRRAWNQKSSNAVGSRQEVTDEQLSNGFTESGDPGDDLIDEKGGTERLHEFAGRSDIIVLSCPLNASTKGLVNETFLASMTKGALLVNVARGGIMDYDAVSAALDSGQLGGLATDVTWVEPFDPEDPLLHHPNVIITPHVAGVTDRAYQNMAQIIATSAVQLSEGKEITELDFVI